MNLDLLMLVGSAVLLVAVLAARLASGMGLPSLLIFLAVGMLLEPFGIEMVDPSLAHALGFMALVFILAEGGLTTRWAEIKGALSLATLLATVGVVVSIGTVALFCHLVLGFPLALAVLLGAVTAPTDSAAVFAVLRSVPLPGRIRAVLEGESGLNDAPIVLLVGVATQWSLGALPDGGPVMVAALVVGEFVGGLLLGILFGWLGGRLLKGIALPSSGLYPLGAIGTIVLAYGLGVQLHLSGFAAVYACAVILGNSELPHRAATRSFAEGIGWISQIGLFVMLGVLAAPQRLTPQAVVTGVIIGAFVTFVARPFSVLVCASWFKMKISEQAFVAWAGLRGAVPIIMATVPLAANVPHADELFDAVFVYVVVFTLLQAPTLPMVGRLLRITKGDEAIDIGVEFAPLDRVQADVLKITVPSQSGLHGVTVQELRLPKLTVVATIFRDGNPMAVEAGTRILDGDEILLITPARDRAAVEKRFEKVSRGGRLASWLQR